MARYAGTGRSRTGPDGSIALAVGVFRRAVCVLSRLGRGSVRGPEVPIARNALERLGAAVVELEFGADDEVFDGARDEHFPRSGQRADARSDVYADSGDVVGSPFDLTRVQTGAHFDTERPDIRLKRSAHFGISHINSTFDTNPGMNNRSSGPSPTHW